jgi:hypothetical protein
MRSATGLARSNARLRTRRLVGSHHNDRNKGTAQQQGHVIADICWVPAKAARGQRCRQRSHSRGSRPHSSALQMSLPPTHPHTKLPANLLALTSYHVAPSRPFAFAPGWLRRPTQGRTRQAGTWRVSREQLELREEVHQPLFTPWGTTRGQTLCAPGSKA